MKRVIFIIIFFGFLFIARFAFAAIKINEIYPAPPSGEYEWVEIYNDGNSIVDLSQYSLSDLTNKKIKFIATTLPPLSFEIATSSGVLNNDGDTVFLKNNLEEIIEIATYSANFDSNKTFAKCPDSDGNWFVLNLSTKNATNETACQILTPSPTLTIMPTLTLTPIIVQTPTEESENPTPTIITPTLQSYGNIYISEVMANPPTGEKEWIEIYNDNNFSVLLNNWYVDDLENAGSSPKIFSLEISGKDYGVFNLTSSMFNNDGDSVRLMDFNKNIKDDFEYQEIEQGKTLGRVSLSSDNFCPEEPSKNSANNPCIDPRTTVTPTLILAMGRMNPSPTITKSATLNKPVSINRLINTKIPIISGRETRPLQYSSDVLGISNELIINAHNNKPLINLLTILSTSYSLLTIISILFRMKLSYGKDKKFYSSFVRPS